MEGKVKWFNEQKGFGFIDCDGDDYFVHVSQIQNQEVLQENDDVRFEPTTTERGKQATKVEKF